MDCKRVGTNMRIMVIRHRNDENDSVGVILLRMITFSNISVGNSNGRPRKHMWGL